MSAMTTSTQPAGPAAFRPGEPPGNRAIPPAPLQPGMRAPAFALRCSQHCAATLDDYHGKPLVLVFYVADWHPVCTAQLERFRDAAPELDQLGAALVAISGDSLWSHAAFARAYRLPFLLLSDDDPRGEIARAYGVNDAQTGRERRGLFVVDAGGAIAWSAVFPEALDPGVDGVLTALEALAEQGSAGADAPTGAPAAGPDVTSVESARCPRCRGDS